MKNISYKEYKAEFGLDSDSESQIEAKKYLRALEYAIKTREFEIQLYWERAKYFWTFIGAAFAAFGVIQKIGPGDEKVFLSILISCLGLLFSFAWYCVNRGSKQWQENWENHVSLLENDVIGPLFKTVLLRHESQKNVFRDFLIGPGQFSVSKINQIVSLYVTCFWIFLLGYSTPIRFDFKIDSIVWSYTIPIILTFITCVIIFFFGRSDFNSEKIKFDHIYAAKQFKDKIESQKKNDG